MGQAYTKRYNLDFPPTMIKLRQSSSDAMGYYKVTLDDTALINHPGGSAIPAYSNNCGNVYWLENEHSCPPAERTWPILSGFYGWDVSGCSANPTQKSCAGWEYFGGFNQCGQGASITRTFDLSQADRLFDAVRFYGFVWFIDSWDGEQVFIEIKNAAGTILTTRGFTGNFRSTNTVCPGTGGWNDNFRMVDIVVPHTYNAGDITVRIYNSLN